MGRDALLRLGKVLVDELQGGVPYVTWPNTSSNALALAVSFRDGVHYEKEREWGFAHFLEHLHFKRTRNFPDFLSIVSSIEEAGGKISAYSTRESITYWVLVPFWHLDRAVRVLEEILTHGTFLREDVEKEKKLIHEEIIREKANPRFYNKLFVEEVLTSPRGLCRHPLGSRRSISEVTKEEMERYKKESYSLANMCISAAGSVERDALAQALGGFLAAFPQGHRRAAHESLEPAPSRSGKRFMLAYAGARQSNLSLGWLLPAPERRERYTWQLLNTLLGVGYSSYLFQRLREERALTYLTQTSLRFYETVGTWRIDLDCFEENILPAIEEIRAIIETLRDGRLPPEHLERARKMHWGGLLLSMEDGLERARWLAHTILSRDAACDLAQIEELIMSAGPEDIVRLAREHLDFDKAVISIAGDPERVTQRVPDEYTVLDQY
jgi:predicted Zn-dependent peptidase